MTRLPRVAAIVIVLLIAAQAIRPDQTNPATDPNRTIQAQLGASPAVAIIDRACSDCHSNATVWPLYTKIAPVSWLMVYGVRKGRKVLNFSEWADYPPEIQRSLLVASCRDVSAGTMPGVYTVLHPEMRLSPQDVDAICSVTRAGL